MGAVLEVSNDYAILLTWDLLSMAEFIDTLTLLLLLPAIFCIAAQYVEYCEVQHVENVEHGETAEHCEKLSMVKKLSILKKLSIA